MNILADVSAAKDGARLPIVRAQALGKRYHLHRGPGHLLAHAVFGSLLKEPPAYVALENVSFDLLPGDALAVIGRNGAGKSTLLQILAGVLKPTSGSALTSGRIAGLLELGSGFNPEFSGRENVFINGAILGLTERQIRGRIDDIITFAEIGDYIDRPVKTYSSGMFLRLAFSVAIHAEPDLLLVDEALAVGDVFFQQKCYARLNELRKRGMTVLLVTHSMADAAEFCNRGMVLSQGRKVFEGRGKEAVEYYFHHEFGTPTGRGTERSPEVHEQSLSGSPVAASGPKQEWDPFEANPKEILDLSLTEQFGVPSAKAVKALIADREGKARRVFQQGEWLRVYIEFLVQQPVEFPLVGVQLINVKGVLVHGRNSLQFDAPPPAIDRVGTILRCVHDIKLDIDVGEYTLEAGLAELPKALFSRRQTSAPSEIAPHIQLLSHVSRLAAISVIHRHQGDPCLFSHYGVADLPSEQQLSLLPEAARTE
ncbi:lipopolysaccharide transport system ATP-binding protein [Bradyrhizobium sp. USDA 4524]|uniref:ABC transporter ATP-binding protein n=1 Tax=unclassified Bradyrhizobium TaxID=2631580 RepID=UPI00209F1C13|nr:MULTISPECIES: ABC transporter ATP-binding protein [unclassified Bradyrhizobium]MCP1845529.1 lipopolysaccharide transport system ATP-binding protein [Bradyrhizobium sp. USDA 4538]MCP1907149.1 lipopolysaccharide transport system ATP-binding protein [Bradyrhizobium sp. USDA 4537]MCP1985625.1 lipopolysaccharide transport system ATP-binding protein [Bradyrhizobium sp. USDA 4539]